MKMVGPSNSLWCLFGNELPAPGALGIIRSSFPTTLLVCLDAQAKKKLG